MSQQAKDAIGPAAWALLTQHWGGRELRIPATRNSKTWRDLCAVIGSKAADALIDLYAGDALSVPLGAHLTRKKRMQALYRMRQQGASIAELVQASRHERTLTARTIKRQLAEVRNSEQPELFGEG